MARRIGSVPSRMRRRPADPRPPAISVVRLEVQTTVEARDLVAVAVEHERRPAPGEQATLADAPLRRLAPARMVHLRVHVGIEAVLAGVGGLPGDGWLILDQADAHDR